MLDWVIGVVGSSLAFAVGAAWMRRRRLARLTRTGDVHCGVRVVSGVQTGLTRAWTHGRAEVAAPAVLRFTTFRSDLTIATGDTVEIEVQSVDDHGFARTTPPREAFSVAPGSTRVTVRTATAELDVAVVGDVRALVRALTS